MPRRIPGTATIRPVLDLLIAGASVVDGTGAPAFDGSVGVAGDRIAWLGRDGAEEPESALRIEARGRALSPGFRGGPGRRW